MNTKASTPHGRGGKSTSGYAKAKAARTLQQAHGKKVGSTRTLQQARAAKDTSPRTLVDVQGVKLKRDPNTGAFVSVTIPYKSFVRITKVLKAYKLNPRTTKASAAEDAADIAAAREVRERIAAGTEEILPGAMVARLLSGESRVRIWREHRRLTQTELATKASLAQENVSQIETGTRAATVETLQRIARALDVTLDDVAPLPPED